MNHNAATATRSAPATRTWAAWIPRQRVDARHNLRFAALTDRQRVLLLILEYVWKSKPYGFTSNAELADLTGWTQRKVQRTLEELQRDGFIHRELIPGRLDRVTGRQAVTGRLGIVALQRLTDQPVATSGQDLDQVLEMMHRDRERRHPTTVSFPDQTVGARQNRPRLHDNFGGSCTSNLSSGTPPRLREDRARAGNSEEYKTTITTPDPNAETPIHIHAPSESSSSFRSLLQESETPPDPTPGAQPTETVFAPRIPAAETSNQPITKAEEPVQARPTPTAAVELPAELVTAAAAALPGVSRAWLASLLGDCGEYGLTLALLVVAWVKVRQPGKPTRYARVALAGWLNQLRAGTLTLEDVRAEVQGRPGSRASPVPFDPSACLARLESHGWTIVPHSEDQVIRAEIPARGAPLWTKLPSELRTEIASHQPELKAYVLKRAAARGKASAPC